MTDPATLFSAATDATAKLGRDEPTGLGAAMAGGKARLATTERRALDFYPTPPEATHALLLAEADAMRRHGNTVWEPCGRGGAIARVLRKYGFRTIASDIIPDPENDVARADLLAVQASYALVVVTNPPFALCGPMIAHLLGQLRVPYLALLLKTQVWSTNTEDRGRIGLYRNFPPDHRWDCTWRVDFTGQKNSTMNVSWFIWDAHRRASNGGARTWGLLSPSGPVETTDFFAGERP